MGRAQPPPLESRLRPFRRTPAAAGLPARAGDPIWCQQGLRERHGREGETATVSFASQGDLADKRITFAELAPGAYAYTAEGDPNSQNNSATTRSNP